MARYKKLENQKVVKTQGNKGFFRSVMFPVALALLVTGASIGLLLTLDKETGKPFSIEIDDDAVLGNRETATVAIVQFSDFECPACQHFHENTYPEIKANYIDTGKVVMVHRDFVAVPSHNPAAEEEALQAECARGVASEAGILSELTPDEIYFAVHDYMYENSEGNGGGVNSAAAKEYILGLGIDQERFDQCVANSEYSQEIADDQTAAQNAEITGTPAFIIGKINPDGTVEGELVVGAKPYTEFQEVIEKYL